MFLIKGRSDVCAHPYQWNRDLYCSQHTSVISHFPLQHTVEVLDREFEDKQGFDNFKAEGQ